jgi:hypothetical protein
MRRKIASKGKSGRIEWGVREGKYAGGTRVRTSILSVTIVIVFTAIVVTITISIVVVIIIPSIISIVRSLPSSSSSSAATAIRHRYLGTGLQAEGRSVRTRVYGILTPIMGEGEGEREGGRVMVYGSGGRKDEREEMEGERIREKGRERE